MHVKEFVTSDTDVWLQLRMRLWPETAPEQQRKEIADILADPSCNIAFLCIDSTNEPLGFIEVSLRRWAEGCHSTPVGYIEGWYVMDHVRGQDVGTLLMQTAETWAYSQGCIEMASDVEIDNQASEAAHCRLGYEIVTRVTCFRKSLGANVHVQSQGRDADSSF